MLVLGVLCGTACFAAEPVKTAAITPGGLPPADPTSIHLPIDPNDPAVAGYRVLMESTVMLSRKNRHEAKWKTYTPSDRARLPAWFKCTVTANGAQKEFTLYEVGAQGKRHAVIIRFADPADVVGVDGAPGADLTKPLLIEPMLYWDDNTQTGSKNYTVRFRGDKCVFYVVYADYWDVTHSLTNLQPGDGAPPPAGSGQEH